MSHKKNTDGTPQVVDFFRTVNKDAHKLKRMGSDGVHGCGGLVVRFFASCLRRVGVGNPGASVESMAFGTVDPLDFPLKDGSLSPTGGAAGAGIARGGSTRVAPLQSGEYAMEEEELEEEEDDADEEELSAQARNMIRSSIVSEFSGNPGGYGVGGVLPSCDVLYRGFCVPWYAERAVHTRLMVRPKRAHARTHAQ